MAITDYKVSEAYAGRDISSLPDRPNEAGMSASLLKARFDQLGKEVIPNYNDLIDFINLNLFSGGTQIGHTHNVDILEDGTTNRLYTDVEKTKLAGIENGAEVNQNAFSNVKVGSTTIPSMTKMDTLELVAGLNITMTVDALTKKISLSATGDLATEAVQSLIVDIGNYFTSLNVEGALQEVGAKLIPSVSKTTPVDADTLLISDSADSSIFKKLSWANIKATLKTYFDTLYNIGGATAKATPVDADQIGIADSATSNTIKKVTFANLKTFFKTYFDTLYQSVLVSGTNIKTINGNSVLGSGDLVIATSSDWNTITATLTYTSADSPTFVANTSIDLTLVISVGMKLKLTQTTVKYFIVTAITSTTITLYGGTDYTLVNTTITLPSFSSMKAPFGFPMNPDKWSVTVTDITFRSQIPVGATVYNIGGVNIVIPIGVWNVSFSVLAQIGSAAATSGPKYMTVSLSTTTTNNDAITSAGLAGGDLKFTRLFVQKNMLFTLTNKTTYYFNSANNGADGHELFNLNNESSLILKAVCAYL